MNPLQYNSNPSATPFPNNNNFGPGMPQMNHNNNRHGPVAPPQYNPNPNIPITANYPSQSMGPPQYNTNPQAVPNQMNRNQMNPQNNQQKKNSYILFHQSGCEPSNEFIKLLTFSSNIDKQFIKINISNTKHKIPDKVKRTPTIFINFQHYDDERAFKWLRDQILKEQQNRTISQQNIPNQRMGVPHYSASMGTVGANAPSQAIPENGPGGQPPSKTFNTYNPKSGEPAPIIGDMSSNRSDNYSFIGNDSMPLVHDYAFIKKENPQQSSQQYQQQRQQQLGLPSHNVGRQSKFNQNSYDSYLQNRNGDPYIPQSGPPRVM